MNQGSHQNSLEHNPIIRFDRVTKIFVSEEIETHALSGVHLSVHSGEFVAIVGPSGCGKSTLLSIAGLLDTPSDGEYYLMDQDVSGLSMTQRTKLRNKHIGFIFQAFNLIGDLTVFENIELPLIYRNIPAAQRKEMTHEVLERIKMRHRTKHYPTQLSGGQQQKVALARALVIKPEILLADEPTGNLDSHNCDVVMGILRDANRDGTTVCMVTHEPRYTRYAERTLHMFDGKIVDETESGYHET